MANRIIDTLNLDLPDFKSFASTRCLRNRKIPAFSNNITDRQDFIFRLFLYKNLHLIDTTSKVRFDSKKVAVMVKKHQKSHQAKNYSL